MSKPLQVFTAATDQRTHCCKCGGLIKQGHEFAIAAWSNGGGFDHLHVECPAHEPMLDPEARVVQGHDKPARR